MSGTEILVILFGLFVGYWVVSKFGMGTTKKEPAPAVESEPEPKQESPVNKAETTAWHLILNVSPHATVDQIRRAYKTMMSQYHPDKVATLGDELKALSERKTKEINIAYDQAMQKRGAGV